MALLQIGEVFGHDTALGLPPRTKNPHPCPFQNGDCTKVNKKDPLGICSFTDGKSATVVCPTRFLEQEIMFHDAARIAFGNNVDFVALPEVRLLEVKGRGRTRKIGKVDFLLARMEKGEAVDFAALEVQAVYISGKTIRPFFDHFLKTGELKEDGKRRTDFRSSGPKRLMPQLALKVPIFRRWGKRFFVAVDSNFLGELPPIKATSLGNSEITWLSYNFQRQLEGGYRMQTEAIIHTVWEDVEEALREGTAPEKSELLAQLTKSARKLRHFKT